MGKLLNPNLLYFTNVNICDGLENLSVCSETLNRVEEDIF